MRETLNATSVMHQMTGAFGMNCTLSLFSNSQILTSSGSGRNVCVSYLLGECGLRRKCYYSHDRTYLPPDGWWNDPKMDFRSFSALLQPMMNKAIYEECGIRNKDAFLTHLKGSFERAAQKVPKETTSTSQPLAPEFPVKSFVLLLSLENESFFTEILDHVLKALRDKIQVTQALTHQDALKHLSSPALAGVFVIDAGIVRAKSSAVVNKLVAYVKDGGSAVIAGCFSNFVTSLDLNKFFKNAWGLDWKYGSYFRTTFSVNPSNELAKRNPSLVTSYSMKALHLANISPEMALYGDYTGATPLKESPAACARVGRGLLGYLGDVNAEISSTNVVLAMLGLLDLPNEPLPSRPITPLPGVAQLDGSDDPLRKNENEKSAKISNTMSGQEVLVPDRLKFVMAWPSFDSELYDYDDLFQSSEEEVEVLQDLSNPRIIDLLPSPDLLGVFITHSSIVDYENRYLLSKLVEYSKNGGTIIFGANFHENIAGTDIRSFFFDNWGLSWEPVGGQRVNATVSLNPKNSLVVKNSGLTSSFRLSAHYLKGIAQFMAVYTAQNKRRGSSKSKNFQSPVLYTGVQKGYVGYIGIEDTDEIFPSIFCAMLGVSYIPHACLSVFTIF